MDRASITTATDNDLRSIGLQAKGDILALRSFCKRAEISKEKQSKIDSLMKYLKEPKRSKKEASKKEAPSKPSKAELRCSLGWKHFNTKENAYVQKKVNQGGGTRKVKLARQMDEAEVLEKLKSVFFPAGSNGDLELKHLYCNLANFMDLPVSPLLDKDGNKQAFTVGLYKQMTGLTEPSLYLLTREKEIEKSDATNPTSTADRTLSPNANYIDLSATANTPDPAPSAVLNTSENDLVQFSQDLEIPNLPECFPSFADLTNTPSNGSLIGTSAERAKELEEMNGEYEESLRVDREKARRKEDLETLVRNAEETTKRLETLRRCREQAVGSKPEIEDPHTLVSVRHLTLGVVTRGFHINSTYEEVYNWVGSLALEPEHFHLLDFHRVQVEVSCPLTEKYGILNMEASEEPVYEVDTEIILNDGTRHSQAEDLDDTVEMAPEDTLFKGRSDLKVRRTFIKLDVIQAFKDPLLNTSSVNIIFIDQRGREEEGSGVGVTRELLTSFWEEIWKSTSLGCEEKVPSIRHDLQKAEWEAIGKFLVFGTDYGYFPTELSVVFLIACLFGEDYITTERLLKSFENYLAKDDKDLMSYCLSEDFSEDAEEYEDVLDFLGSYKCYKRPNKENIKSIIEELAHQELVQRPKYVISCWEDVLVVLKNSLHFSTIEGIERFFDKLEPTTKKVVKLFKVPQTMNDAERECFSFLTKYVKTLGKRELKKFLTLATGANVICVEKIDVMFNIRDGFGRTPIFRTCGPLLELPSTYQHHGDLFEEIENIMKRDFSFDFV